MRKKACAYGNNTLRGLAHAMYGDFFSALKVINLMGKKLIFFKIFALNIDCGYRLEPPHGGGSNTHPRSRAYVLDQK